MRRAAQRACLALLLATTALLVSCDGRHGHRTVLHVWAMGREAEVLAQLLPEFERDHPEVQVEIQQLAWTAAHEKLLTAVAGDATPDICQLGNSWIPELVALHALVPLDARVQASQAITASDYFAGVWRTNSVDGAQYGVPWYVDTRLLFYRADILKQAGFNAPASNWADWLVQLRAIKRVVGAERYSILLPLNEFEPLQVLALQQDESMLRDGNRYGNFESASFQRALGFYHQLFAESLAPRETNTQISNVWSELGKGYFSFYISGPWNIGEFKRRLAPEQQGSWMTAPMPGPDGPGVSNAGGSSLVIFKRSRYQAGAWALIEFLSRPDTQRRFYELTGDLPPRRSSWESGEISTDPYTRAFRTQLEQLRTFPQVPEWEQIMQAMRVMAERVVQDRESVATASREFDVEVDAMLAKRRWLLDKRAGGKVNGR